MEKHLGVITIGQSPRDDMLREMKDYLGKKTKIHQIGALDGLTYEDIINLGQVEDENILVTKLRDGRAVSVVESFIFPRVQECIYCLEEENVDLILLLCTGVFSRQFSSNKTIIYPQRVLHGLVGQLVSSGQVAIVTPEKGQIPFYQEKWSKLGDNIYLIYGSPYESLKEVDRIISQLDKRNGADLIVLDCMGYSLEMKENLYKRTNIPVILAKTLVARVIGELLG